MDLYFISTSGSPIKPPPQFLIQVKKPKEILTMYCNIGMKFLVNCELKIDRVDHGLGGIKFNIVEVEYPWVKDYDSDEDITELPSKWDLSNWSCFLVMDDNKLVGGCIIARDTDTVNLLRGRSDLAVIWDIRVDNHYRYQGLGSMLFDQIVSWTKNNNCNEIHVETQQINVPACKFYVKMGMELIRVDTEAYNDHPKEIQLIWRKLI